MNNLQDALNQFNETKLGKVKETVISHILGAQRASEVRLKLYEDRRVQKQNDPKVIEENKLKSEEMKLKKIVNKEKRKERGKTLGSTKGKLNMTDYTREMSKVPTMCPNCKRTVGYSDDLIIENHKKGLTASQISRDSNVSYPQTKLIIRNYKKNITS